MKVKYEFEPEEVMEDYRLIAETFSRQIVRTGKGIRLYNYYITSKGYDDIAQKIIKKAKHAVSHGLTNPVTLTIEEIRAQKELVIYCVGL